MKSITLITFISLISFSQLAFSQTEIQLIHNIDSAATEIKNNLQKFTKVEKLKDSKSAKYIYLKGKELQLVTMEVKDADVIKNVDWYYHDAKLFYSEQTWTDTATKKIVDFEKFYFNNNHLIWWIEADKKPVNKTSTEYIQTDNQLSSFGAFLYKKEME